MSRLSYSLCVVTNLGLGLAIYAYGFMSMPGWNTAAARHDKPQPAASAKPSQDTITGSISPEAKPRPQKVPVRAPLGAEAKPRLQKIPGIRFASINAETVPPPNPERWTPTVGYNSVVAPPKQVSTKKLRKTRPVRPYHRSYYRRPNFGFSLGIGPSGYW